MQPTSQHLAPVGNRLPFLDGLRALAALWVLFGHVHLFALGWQQVPLALPLNALVYMHLGVDLFLVLSGFCLALPVVRRGGHIEDGLPAFFAARALRILPPYLAALLLILAVNCVVPIVSWGRNDLGLTATMPAAVFWSNLMLMQDVLPEYNHVNGPFWSIACEWHLYFTFPPLVWVLRRYGVRGLLLAGTAAATGLSMLSACYPQLPLLHIAVPQPPFYIALFVMGIAAAALAAGPDAALRRRSGHAGWLLLALVPLTWLLWRYRISDGASAVRFAEHYMQIDLLAGAASAALLLVLCRLSPTHWARRAVEWPALVGVGGFSYSLYLIHVPIVASVYYLMGARGWNAGWSGLASFGLLALVGGPLCLALAWTFAQVFERRIGWRPFRQPAIAGQR